MTLTHPGLAGLPGIDLAPAAATDRPDVLRMAGADLFAGVVRPGATVNLASHRACWGRNPQLPLTGLAGCAESANLRGAGGAGFPTHRKLRSMAGRRVTTVVVNGSEGEPTSAKDGMLLLHVPHLVLDGAAAVARATACHRVTIQIGDDRPAVAAALKVAVAERDDRGIEWSVQPVADRFVAGEASAVIRKLTGGDPVPGDLGKPPRDPRRLRRGHVFLSNVETFARLALAARGHVMTTALVTASGAVDRPGVYEVPASWTVADLALAAGVSGDPQILITGGWHGAWSIWPDVAGTALDRDRLAAAGGRWGAGAFVWIPRHVPPRQALTGITRWLAGESAGQCAPCVIGLPALAGAVARGGAVTQELSDVDGRGLCAHPTATAAAVRSALTTITTLETRR